MSVIGFFALVVMVTVLKARVRQKHMRESLKAQLYPTRRGLEVIVGKKTNGFSMKEADREAAYKRLLAQLL